MKYFLVVVMVLAMTACGPSASERVDIAKVACSVLGESRNMDAAFRVKEINEARNKLNAGAYVDGDSGIKESFAYGLCEELVLDENYEELLSKAKELKAELERVESSETTKRLEAEKRVAEEAKRVADRDSTGGIFRADNSARPEVTTLESGLQYEVLVKGKGPKPSAEDTVVTHYHGTLTVRSLTVR